MIDRYLGRYMVGRRIVALLCSVFWAATFAMIWTLFCSWLKASETIWTIGAGLTVASIAPRFIFLFRRYNAVAVAIEIESAQPLFDQRLVTVVSQQKPSPLTEHLQTEMAPLLQQDAAALVRWRPLLLPAMTMISVACIYCLLLHQLRHISR